MQQSSNNAKTLNAAAGKQGRVEGNTNNSNHLGEGGTVMVSIVGQKPQKFDTEIRVGNKTVFAADSTVWVHTEIGALSFTPEQACAFAAALSAVGVHVMEEASEVAA